MMTRKFFGPDNASLLPSKIRTFSNNVAVPWPCRACAAGDIGRLNPIEARRTTRFLAAFRDFAQQDMSHLHH